MRTTLLKLVLNSLTIALTLAGLTSSLAAQTTAETAARPSRATQPSPSEKWESAIREFEKADLETPPLPRPSSLLVPRPFACGRH